MPPGIKWVLRAPPVFHGVDDRVKCRSFAIFFTTIATDQGAVLFLEQYLLALIASFHIFTCNWFGVIAVADTRCHL